MSILYLSFTSTIKSPTAGTGRGGHSFHMEQGSMYLESKLISSLQDSQTRRHPEDGSRPSSGPEEVKQSPLGSRVSQLAAPISITTSQSSLPLNNPTKPSGPTSFLFGDTDQKATDSVSNHSSRASLSTVNSSLSASTATEIGRKSERVLSDGISLWETSAASMLVYGTKNGTANDTLLGMVPAYTSPDTQLPSYIDKTIRPTVMADPLSETTARHFASAVNDTMRDPSHSHLHLIPSTRESLINAPGQPRTEMTSTLNPWIDSVSSSPIITEIPVEREIPDVEVTETMSQTGHPTRSAGYDPTIRHTRASQTKPVMTIGAVLGAVSGAGFLFAIVYVLQRLIRAYLAKSQANMPSAAPNEVEPNGEEPHPIHYGSEREISRFSIDS